MVVRGDGTLKRKRCSHCQLPLQVGLIIPFPLQYAVVCIGSGNVHEFEEQVEDFEALSPVGFRVFQQDVEKIIKRNEPHMVHHIETHNAVKKVIFLDRIFLMNW